MFYTTCKIIETKQNNYFVATDDITTGPHPAELGNSSSFDLEFDSTSSSWVSIDMNTQILVKGVKLWLSDYGKYIIF